MKKKILIVDDESQMVDTLQSRLTTNGYEVITAYNGKDGLRKAREAKPDVVILDVVMPVMDGFEVLYSLRKADIDIPIIMLTAKRETDAILPAQEYKATDYLMKPVDMRELVSLVDKCAQSQERNIS